jgi:hypothetical protein
MIIAIMQRPTPIAWSRAREMDGRPRDRARRRKNEAALDCNLRGSFYTAPQYRYHPIEA